MENYLKINDLVTFDFLNPDLASIQDDFKNSRGPFEKINDITDIKNLDAKGLKVRIAATHSGIVTRNNMFYLPDKMKKATPTFLEDYGKPILKHHNEKVDSIGRIIESSYIDTSGLIKDTITDAALTETALQDFCSGKMPFSYQVDFVRKYFNRPINDASSFMTNQEYIGLGHVQIIADITDPEAIQKFIDGRYLTGSVGARTNRAVCSICKQDYTKDGPCEHDPGGVYDDKKCVLIAGDFFYDEYSVVNNPADRQSKVLELYYNGDIKNIEVKNEHVEDKREIRLYFPQYDKEERMPPEQKKEETEKIEDSVQETGENKEEIKNETQSEETTEVKDETETLSEVTIEDVLAQVVEEEKLSEDHENMLYDAMFEGFEDAKLSAEKRKSLKKSTFCGPDKSFPVPDCAHVTAARRLIDRYKGEGDKSKILASVDRKAKAMGCDKKTKDAVSHAQVLHMLTQAITEHMYEKNYREKDGKPPVLSDEDVSALTAVMKNLAGMVGKDNFVAALSSDAQELKDVVKHFQDIDLLDEIISLEETMGELRDELTETEEQRDALKEEYDILQNDSDSIRDELIEEKKKLRDFQVDKLSLLTSLKDGEVTDEQKNEWVSLTDDVLETSLNKLAEEVDIKKMADKLNDGTSRNPEGEVEDPTLSYEDMPQDIQDKIDEIKSNAFKYFDDINKALSWQNVQVNALLQKEKVSKDL